MYVYVYMHILLARRSTLCPQGNTVNQTRVMAKRVSVHIGRINAGMENNSKSTKEIKKNEAF